MLCTHCSMCGHLNNSKVIFLFAHIDILLLVFSIIPEYFFSFQTASVENSGGQEIRNCIVFYGTC